MRDANTTTVPTCMLIETNLGLRFCALFIGVLMLIESFVEQHTLCSGEKRQY
jgi:hypothetical protein